MARTARTNVAPPNGSHSEWLDKMVKKLQRELERQLNRVRKARPEKDDARLRAANVRTLYSLEHTLERLARLERERAAIRETKVQKHDQGARTALERRLDKLLGAGGPGKTAGGDQ